MIPAKEIIKEVEEFSDIIDHVRYLARALQALEADKHLVVSPTYTFQSGNKTFSVSDNKCLDQKEMSRLIRDKIYFSLKEASILADALSQEIEKNN